MAWLLKVPTHEAVRVTPLFPTARLARIPSHFTCLVFDAVCLQAEKLLHLLFRSLLAADHSRLKLAAPALSLAPAGRQDQDQDQDDTHTQGEACVPRQKSGRGASKARKQEPDGEPRHQQRQRQKPRARLPVTKGQAEGSGGQQSAAEAPPSSPHPPNLLAPAPACSPAPMHEPLRLLQLMQRCHLLAHCQRRRKDLEAAEWTLKEGLLRCVSSDLIFSSDAGTVQERGSGGGDGAGPAGAGDGVSASASASVTAASLWQWAGKLAAAWAKVRGESQGLSSSVARHLTSLRLTSWGWGNTHSFTWPA